MSKRNISVWGGLAGMAERPVVGKLQARADAAGHGNRTRFAGVGGLVGGMLGSFGGPLGAVVGAAIGAGLGSRFGDEVDADKRGE